MFTGRYLSFVLSRTGARALASAAARLSPVASHSALLRPYAPRYRQQAVSFTRPLSPPASALAGGAHGASVCRRSRAAPFGGARADAGQFAPSRLSERGARCATTRLTVVEADNEN